MTLHIQKAGPQLKERALRTLFHAMPSAELDAQIKHVLEAEQNNQLDLRGLYLAQHADQEVGACLTLLQADESAFLWPPEIIDESERDAVGAALIQHIIDDLKQTGVVFIQSMLEIDDEENRELLEKNGFPHLADLIFMERKIQVNADSLSAEVSETNVWKPRTLDEGVSQELFCQTLERTYKETQDVPEFSCFRSGPEAFKSHQVTGPFQPELWTLFFDEDQPAGVLLLRDYQPEKRWELAYMGVVPEYRGKGLGADMIQHAIQQAENRDCRVLYLAVDVKNSYALERYNEFGFQTTGTKSVFICK